MSGTHDDHQIDEVTEARQVGEVLSELLAADGALDEFEKAMAAGDADELRRAMAERAASSRQADPSANLTERELQVLRGMSQGKSNAEIGRSLFLSEDTVKTHARRLFRKLGAGDRADAVARGFRQGLLR